MATSLERMMDHANHMAHLVLESDFNLDSEKTPIIQISAWQKAIKNLMINIRTRNSFEIEESRQLLKQAQLEIVQ